VCVRKPTANGDSVLWVEDVRCRRIINDDCFTQITSDLRKIFDVISLVIITTLTEQSMVHNVMDVQLVKERIPVLFFFTISDGQWDASVELTLETDAVKTTTS